MHDPGSTASRTLKELPSEASPAAPREGRTRGRSFSRAVTPEVGRASR